MAEHRATECLDRFRIRVARTRAHEDAIALGRRHGGTLGNAREIDPFDPANWHDPHPGYHALRDTAPIWHNPTFDNWILTRYADCEQMLRDTRFSSNPAHLRGENAERDDIRMSLLGADANILLFLDPPDHTRLRRLVGKAFTPRVVDALRPRIRTLVDELLDVAVEKGTFDVISEVAYPLPVIVICELLGVPAEDRHLFGPWSAAATRLLDGDISMEETSAGVLAAMSLLNYLNGLIEDRRARPRDDLLSRMIAAEESGDMMTEAELRMMSLLLFLAGHETTQNLIGNGTYALLRHPDQWNALREDASPDAVATAVEELLRFDGPVHVTARIAVEDVEVGGEHFDAGTQFNVLLAAANRDPSRFADPDRLDVRRHDNKHLTFSGGIHYCLGAALARVEGQETFAAMARRMPSLSLAEDPAYRPHLVLRGLAALSVSA